MPRPPVRPYRILSASNECQPSNLLVSVPHAGRRYDWLAGFQAPTAPLSVLRRGEDPYVDSLALPLVRQKRPIIIQSAPRVLADVNRAPDDMDPQALLDSSESAGVAPGGMAASGVAPGGLPPSGLPPSSVVVAGAGDSGAYAAGVSTMATSEGDRPNVSEKAQLGLGVVPTRLGTDALYAGKLNPEDFARRLAHFHRPYHDAIDSMIAQSRCAHDRVLILDLHSMPRLRPQPLPSAHFVLGNRFGRSCPDWLLERGAVALEELGFSVARNLPYAGGYVVERHATPEEGFYALQVEICRSTYLTQSAQRNLGELWRPAAQHARKAPLSKKGCAQVVRALCILAEVLQSSINQPISRSKAAE